MFENQRKKVKGVAEHFTVDLPVIYAADKHLERACQEFCVSAILITVTPNPRPRSNPRDFPFTSIISLLEPHPRPGHVIDAK